MDVAANIRGKAWPPKLQGNKLASFEDTWVASSGVVMVTSHNRVAQVSISGDVDAALVSQDASIVMPVREARAEGSRDCTRESMEGIKDQRVRSRGGAKFVGKRGVNEVDEECVREQGDCLIVCVGSGDVIWPAGQGIRGTEIFAWDVFKS